MRVSASCIKSDDSTAPRSLSRDGRSDAVRWPPWQNPAAAALIGSRPSGARADVLEMALSATLQVQRHGKGKFEPARVELDLNVLRVGIAVGSTLRLTVRAPKSKRKGQPHAFRVDLGEKDRTGVASGHYAGVAYDQRMDGGDGGGGGGGG